MDYPTNNNENYNHEKFCKDFKLFCKSFFKNFGIYFSEDFAKAFCKVAEPHTPNFILTNNIYDCFKMLLGDMYYIFWYQNHYGVFKFSSDAVDCGRLHFFMKAYVEVVNLSKSDELKARKFESFDKLLSGEGYEDHYVMKF